MSMSVNARIEQRIVPGVIVASFPLVDTRFANVPSVCRGGASTGGASAFSGGVRADRPAARGRETAYGPRGASRSASGTNTVARRAGRIEADPVRELPGGRRATLVVLVAVVALLLCAMGFKQVEGTYANLPTEVVVVSQGDTLWSICERHPVDGMSTQECVAWTKSINGLDSSCLVPGQLIEVASSASDSGAL